MRDFKCPSFLDTRVPFKFSRAFLTLYLVTKTLKILKKISTIKEQIFKDLSVFYMEVIQKEIVPFDEYEIVDPSDDPSSRTIL